MIINHAVAIRIELPRKVNTCSPLVSISPGNSAGASFPTEIEVGKLHYMLMGTTKVGSDFWGLGFTFFVCVFFFFFKCNHSDSISSTSSETDATKSVETPSVVTKVEQGLNKDYNNSF